MTKIVYGWKHSLTLVRKIEDDAIFRAAADGGGKVSLDKISLLMSHVIPADAEKFSIYKTIESKAKLLVAYKTGQSDMLSVPESTSFTWRLSVTTTRHFTPFHVRCQQADRKTQNPLLLISK